MNKSNMNKQSDQFIGYLKFYGPSVEEGKIDIEKVGNSLIALNRLFKKQFKKDEPRSIALKLGKIKKKCTEINIFFEQLVPIARPIAEYAPLFIVAKSIGITELGKQFFGTIGQQIALKLFSKGQEVEKQKEVFENDKIYVMTYSPTQSVGVSQWSFSYKRRRASGNWTLKEINKK